MTWADGIEVPSDFKLHSYTTGRDGGTTSEKHVRVGRPESEVIHVPSPAFVSKTSTLYDKDGEVAAQWVMQRPEDKQRQETFEAWAAAAMEGFPARPLVPLSPHFAHTNDDLLVSYPIGDHHIGMLAWKHEVGVSNDIELAEALLSDAMSFLVAGSPVSSYALVEVLGDFFHYDSFDSVTPTNRNLLDSDGRAPKMISAGFRLIEQVIVFALEKHTHVHVMVELGNHDRYTSMVMARYIERIFRDNPRVTVDINPSHFHYYEWGSCLFGTTHGDARAAKPANLPGIMAVDQREAWGRTKYRYWKTGHIHQQKVYEFPGCTVESFPILPPGDAYAYNEGYRSKREMKAIVYHRDYGEVGRQVVNPEMLK